MRSWHQFYYSATPVATRLGVASLFSIALMVAGVCESLTSATFGGTQEIVNCDGYPCVNFSFGANVSREGDLFASTFFTPPTWARDCKH